MIYRAEGSGHCQPLCSRMIYRAVGGEFHCNNGVVLWATNEDTDAKDLRIRSSEYSISDYHPYLEVQYTLPSLQRSYYLKDHLGSTRVVLSATGTVKESHDYYPFGLKMPGRSAILSAGDTRNLFTGKEHDTETGWDYFGARYYSAGLGRWLAVDPLAEGYLQLSPYVYVADNPLIITDPNGKELYTFGSADEHELSLQDLQQFVGESDANRISHGENGRVLINTEGYEEGSNANLDFLISLDRAKDENGKVLRFGYRNSTNPVAIDSKGNAMDYITNASTTPRGEDVYVLELNGFKYHRGAEPQNGFDGEVTISNNVSFFKVNAQTKVSTPYARAQVIGHELLENYNRTMGRDNYFQAHEEANRIYFGGNWEFAIEAHCKNISNCYERKY